MRPEFNRFRLFVDNIIVRGVYIFEITPHRSARRPDESFSGRIKNLAERGFDPAELRPDSRRPFFYRVRVWRRVVQRSAVQRARTQWLACTAAAFGFWRREKLRRTPYFEHFRAAFRLVAGRTNGQKKVSWFVTIPRARAFRARGTARRTWQSLPFGRFN